MVICECTIVASKRNKSADGSGRVKTHKMTKYQWKTKLNNVSYDSDSNEIDYTDEELITNITPIYTTLDNKSIVYALLNKTDYEIPTYEFINIKINK
tara:strand:- start:275 stop:565 length:291 start_codon:yes stop_codon:yes gene_type:complete